MVTRKTVYALRALFHLAQAELGKPLLAAEIAASENIPRRFLDSIATLDAAGTATAISTTDAPSLAVRPGEVVHFQTTWAACSDADTCTGAETYVAFNADTRVLDTKHESVRVSWYATAGTFAHSVTGRDEDEFATTNTDNTWTAPQAAADTRLWLVVRDSRGGQSFQSFIVSVKP